MNDLENKPYLEKPQEQETTKEQLIYGGGETLSEVQDRSEKKKKQLLNE